MNFPPTTVMNPAETDMSDSSAKVRVPFWTRMPLRRGVD